MTSDPAVMVAIRRLTEKVEILTAERGDPGRAAVRVDQISGIVQQAITAALNAAGILSGVGSPEGVVPAKVSTIYRDRTGLPGTVIVIPGEVTIGPSYDVTIPIPAPGDATTSFTIPGAVTVGPSVEIIGPGTALYVKEAGGSGPTGWVKK